MVFLSWTAFKSFITIRQVPISETVEKNGGYLLEAHDVQVSRWCRLQLDTDDIAEYEADYQTAASPNTSDSQGVMFVRPKITKTGWSSQFHYVEFTTSKLNSIINLDKSGSDTGFCSIKFKDNLNVEILTGLQLTLDLSCTQTIVDWEPDFDYEIIGGRLVQAGPPGQDVRLSVVAVPDINQSNGGSVEYVAGGLNLRKLDTGLEMNGRSPRLMVYDADLHTNKFRLKLTHPAGVQHTVGIIFEIFKAD